MTEDDYWERKLDELERLREVNAELLAACKELLATSPCCDDPSCPVTACKNARANRRDAHDHARAAIALAEKP